MPGLQALQVFSVKEDFMVYLSFVEPRLYPIESAEVRFIKDYGSGGGKIEAPFFGYLGDADDSVGVGVLDFRGNAGCFAAEDEPVCLFEFCLPERTVAFGGEEPDGRAFAFGEVEEGFGIIVDGEAESGPIVHCAAAEIFVAEYEAQGTDEMKLGSAGDAGAGDVAGVGGDLRLQERELEAVGLEVKGIRCCQRVFPGDRPG